MTEALAAAASYLVSLSPDHQFLQNILCQGWGKNWCTFLFSNRNYEDIYEHCLGNLLALTEDGETLLFRYFDPRILRVYLPSCTSEELTMFFGPVYAYCCEDDITFQSILFTINKIELIANFPSGAPWVPAKDPLDDEEKQNGYEDSLFDIEETKETSDETNSDANVNEKVPSEGH